MIYHNKPLKSYSENDKIILVFGSNTQGRHGKGTAKIALDYFGAQYGNPKGLQGNSYGIVTKDLTKKEHPSISKYYICKQISELYEFASKNNDYLFLIPYKYDNNNLNGYSSDDMIEMFNSFPIPKNIIFEESFYRKIYKIGFDI